jgi:hypothetical protein
MQAGLLECGGQAAAAELRREAAVAALGLEQVPVRPEVAANTLTLDPANAETIDGAATLAWTTQYQCFTVYSDGTEWWIV